MTNQTIETIMEPAKETAKKIRAALKVAFPGVKFSVRTDVYSGGSSVNVSWTDLPLTEEVEKVVNQFQSGSFNGMEDIYETSGYVMDGKRYVGAKYLFCSRNLSDERKQLIKDWMKENYYEIEENSYEYYHHFNKAEQKMIEEENKQPEQVEEVKENKINLTIENVDNLTVEMKFNEKLNGIELYFSGKPIEEVRNMLKEQGFKWSKYNKCWYVKNTEKTLMFAESFVSAYNDTIEPETVQETEVVEVETTIETEETEQILINDSDLIGRKVLGQWGAMSGFNYGIVTGETIYNEIIVNWEEWEGSGDGQNYHIELKDIVHVHENTNMNAIGIYLLPIEPETDQISNDSNVLTLTLTNKETKHTEQSKQSGKVIDFSSRFQQKQQEKQANQFFDHFINNILPHMTNEEQLKLVSLYKSGNMEAIEEYTNMLSMKCAILAAKEEFNHK
jgi:uncharacterized protein YggL (DUF469 family)